MKSKEDQVDIDEYIETFYHRIRRHRHFSEASLEAFEALSKNA